MAYWRRTYRRRHRRPPFSKRQKAAIVRIAQAPVETKEYPVGLLLSDYFTATSQGGTTADFGFIISDNFISRIPASTNTSMVGNEAKFNGNEIQFRGLRVEIALWTFQTSSATNIGAQYDYWFRFTVYSARDFAFAATYPPSLIRDNVTLNDEPTLFKWNMDYAKIHYQRKFKLDNNGNLNSLTKRKFWVPMRRKLEKAEPMTGLANEVMDEIKGMQFYWVLEGWSPGNTRTLSVDLNGRINTVSYFKDA